MLKFSADPNNADAAAAISANPAYVDQLHTTCVATMLDGGHALNALPQRATANINCHIFPSVSIDAVQATLNKIVANPTVKISVQLPPPVQSTASPRRANIVAAVTSTVHERYPAWKLCPGCPLAHRTACTSAMPAFRAAPFTREKLVGGGSAMFGAREPCLVRMCNR